MDRPHSGICLVSDITLHFFGTATPTSWRNFQTRNIEGRILEIRTQIECDWINALILSQESVIKDSPAHIGVRDSGVYWKGADLMACSTSSSLSSDISTRECL